MKRLAKLTAAYPLNDDEEYEFSVRRENVHTFNREDGKRVEA